jgi:hypothetical protein
MAKLLSETKAMQHRIEGSANSVMVKEAAGDLKVIPLAGRIDASASGELERLFAEQLEQGYTHLVLDMAEVEYIGVAMDTLQQVESQLVMRNYDGFMKRGRIRGRR